MSKRNKTYKRVKFTPPVIKEAEKLLVSILDKKDRKMTGQTLRLRQSDIDYRDYDENEEESFFSDYLKEFVYASFSKHFNWGEGEISFEAYFHTNGHEYTTVGVSMPNINHVEKVFNFLESKVEDCSLSPEPTIPNKRKTDWIKEITNKVDRYCPIAGRKLKTALIKLESKNEEEWQSACMLVRDAWIELADKLCKAGNVDTSDIKADSVVEKLRKLKIDKADEKLFNLARDSFNLCFKHHKRSIENDTAVACVVSSIVSMKTVIQEVLNAPS